MHTLQENAFLMILLYLSPLADGFQYVTTVAHPYSNVLGKTLRGEVTSHRVRSGNIFNFVSSETQFFAFRHEFLNK